MSADVFQALKTSLEADATKTYPEARELLNALAFMMQFQYATEGTPGGGTPHDIETTGDPRVVIAFNPTTATLAVKIYGMAAAFAAKKVTGGALTYANNMITLGAAGTTKFTVGSDGDLNSGDDIIVFYMV